MSYTTLYKKGLTHLDRDLGEIINTLANRESVVLCSPNMGDTRLLDYLANRLKDQEKYHIIYDKKGDLTVEEIETFLSKYENEVKLIILPHLSHKGKDFLSYINRLGSFKRDDILMVSALEYDFLHNPQKYFHSGAPMSHLIIRKPLNYQLTESVIESRRKLNNWNIPKKFNQEIYRLSGGLIGLIKYICSFIDKNGEIDEEELLLSPSIVRCLSSLKVGFDTLDMNLLKNLDMFRVVVI